MSNALRETHKHRVAVGRDAETQNAAMNNRLTRMGTAFRSYLRPLRSRVKGGSSEYSGAGAAGGSPTTSTGW